MGQTAAAEALKAQYPSQFPNAIPADVDTEIAQLEKQIAALKAEIARLTTTPVLSFTRSLRLGLTGVDVRALQVFLNTHGYALADSGPGSPGQETDKFGALTYRAVIRFQQANNIDPIGIVGPKTQARIKAVMGE